MRSLLPPVVVARRTCASFLFLSLSFCLANAQAKKRPVYNFAPVEAVMREVIAQREVPGAVVVVGHKGKVVYRQAFGSRAIEPRREPMTVDTIFDLASLTKPIATATSVMRLVQLGQVRLNDPVAKYIPEFGRAGKEEITVRQLLTHFSGLREDLDLNVPWTGRDEALRRTFDEKPVRPPGSAYIYSDINYIVLGYLVERVSALPLDKYADAHIFQPLGMQTTRFSPPRAWSRRIAPTEYEERGVMMRGVVHDPTARRMGGVAGHAGLFSTISDLSRFAQAMLDGKVLSAPIIEKMTTPQQPANATVLRGLGWDIDSPFSSVRGDLLPVGSYGHTGFTGTSFWVDPYTSTYIIILTNVVHPRLGTSAVSLRSRVANAVSDALQLSLDPKYRDRLLAITGYNETMAGMRRLQSRNGQVLTGIDVLQATNFEGLKKAQPTPAADIPEVEASARVIGLLTNQTGLDADGRRTVDVLANAPGITLAAIFSPEHGALGDVDTADIGDTRDAVTGIPIYSVYGNTDEKKRPRVEVLKTLDAVVVDIADVGVRFYTYKTTLGYFLEAAAQAGIEIIVLDRPNPITGSIVQGPMAEESLAGYLSYHALPVRHGMTVGELAQLFNAERNIGANLRVVPMQGWLRGDWFDSTGVSWVNPSPNLRSVTQATLYPGVGLVEGTNVSVGRGTDTPFEVLGAPWIKSRELADYLNRRNIAGVRLVPANFTPRSSKYENVACGGVNIVLTDRSVLDSPQLGIELASALRKLYPADFKLDRMIDILANRRAFDSLVAGEDPRRIAEDWRDDLQAFEAVRVRYLIYK
ncbi:MAG: DUF1343 domain-containing protein [Acidobacteriales bacterium]|nr:DUF1343 domain-containing protein [Terriglobales bacterium]